MSEIYFHNHHIDPNTWYFLYIGELKNYGLNIFLKEALGRILKRPVDFIAVIPDILEQYDYPNIAVINPMTAEDFLRYKQKFSCRIPAPSFMRAVSISPHIVKLVHQLLDQQDELFIYMYESLPEMSLDDIPGVSILGPSSYAAKKLNNKIYQYQHFNDLVPIPEFRICQGIEDLYATTKDLWPAWSDGIFVTTEYSAAGTNSVIAHSWSEIIAKFKSADYRYLISRYMPHQYDPTILAIVANEKDVYVAGIADQRIEGGNRFTGSTYPTILSRAVQAELVKMTRQVGCRLGQEGYRGIFGCDYVVTEADEIFFVEVNARKQGTTLEFCCTLEQMLPPGAPMLPELEYYAITQQHFPATMQEPTLDLKPAIYWGTYNYKIREQVSVKGFMPYCGDERECFHQTSHRKDSKRFVILEHIGNDFVVGSGSFLGRIVALGQDHAGVQEALLQGRKMIELTIAKTDPDNT